MYQIKFSTCSQEKIPIPSKHKWLGKKFFDYVSTSPNPSVLHDCNNLIIISWNPTPINVIIRFYRIINRWSQSRKVQAHWRSTIYLFMLREKCFLRLPSTSLRLPSTRSYYFICFCCGLIKMGAMSESIVRWFEFLGGFCFLGWDLCWEKWLRGFPHDPHIMFCISFFSLNIYIYVGKYFEKIFG